MTVEKMSLSFDPELARAIRKEARRAKVPVSVWMARAAEREAKLAAGRRLLEEWEREHGPFLDEEIAAAEELWPD